MASRCRRGGRRWRRVRQAAFERDGYLCVDCGSHLLLEGDHVVPLSEGGAEFDVDNVVTRCRRCHKDRTFGPPSDSKIVAWERLIAERWGTE